jgi:hypothetical protein
MKPKIIPMQSDLSVIKHTIEIHVKKEQKTKIDIPTALKIKRYS